MLPGRCWLSLETVVAWPDSGPLPNAIGEEVVPARGCAIDLSDPICELRRASTLSWRKSARPWRRGALSLGGLWLRGLFLQQRLATETDLAGRIDIDHFDQKLLALFELVAHVFHAMVRDLRHVQQAVGPRHDLDERAEVGDALHLSKIGLIELGRRGQLLNDRDRFLRGRFVRRRDVHASIVLDVDLDAGALDDAADHLAARADDVADLVDRNTDRHDARRERGDALARRGERFG